MAQTIDLSGDLTGVAQRIVGVTIGDRAGTAVDAHADHLATPQKMIDASQTIMWDRVQTPFGRQA